ncbi:hypothetical protein FCV25MIE_06079, partial [Fagus crenata]
MDPRWGRDGPTAGQRWTHVGAEVDPRRGRVGPTAGQRRHNPASHLLDWRIQARAHDSKPSLTYAERKEHPGSRKLFFFTTKILLPAVLIRLRL